jgi:hypothetical protein
MSESAQHITTASNLSAMLGQGSYTEREAEIAVKAFDAGARHGRMQVATTDSPIAPALIRELAALHILIDWPEGDATKERIAALLTKARGEP